VNIWSIAISSDDKYIFTSDQFYNGHVKQFSVRTGKMIKDFGEEFWGEGIRSIITTPDGKYLFAAGNHGHLKQICLESQQVVHDYGRIHNESIDCLETTRDSKWLFTGNPEGHLKRISVEKREVDRDL
jgi:WD40 repeat protein